jgi:hypothetical protein
MVAIIKTNYSIQGTLSYNENKVKQGFAECIGEGNYPANVDQMNLTMKLNRFLRLLVLNENIKLNSVHISLNFHPLDKLSKEKLMTIASTYMEKIGFGQQPYLVYQHHDAGHPHIHITSIKIREDGSRIDMHNIAFYKSETARKEIEISFGLVVAQGRGKEQTAELHPLSAAKIQYGTTESKKAIENVLAVVLSSYKYTSLAELNTVLQLYNVYADRGSENSRTFKNNGLLYHILDKNNKTVGVPIKASDFHSKPTLKLLEQQFILNQSYPNSNANRVRNAIDLSFLKQKPSLDKLIELLQKEGISAIFSKSKEGGLDAITYVDHITKCVFSDSALGSTYTAKAIQERTALVVAPEQLMIATIIETASGPSYKTTFQVGHKTTFHETYPKEKSFMSNTTAVALSGILTQSEQTSSFIPNQLKAKRAKKKRKGQTDNQ